MNVMTNKTMNKLNSSPFSSTRFHIYIYITTLVFDHAQLKHIGYLGYTIVDKEVICYPTITNGQHNTAQTVTWKAK